VINPVLARELRERMRTGRAFVVIGVFLALLILTVFLVYQGRQSTGVIEFDLARQTQLGRDLYEWVLFVILALVLFFVPGLTAGAIAGERERQTLLPLQVTLLRPRSILVGKVLAGMSFLVLLLIAAVPVAVVSYLLGGFRLIDGLKGLAAVVLVAFLHTTMVASLSAFTRRVQTATLLGYGFTALLVLLGPLLYITLGIADSSHGNDQANPPAVLVAVNPISIVADITTGATSTGASNPLRAIRSGVADAKANNNDSWFAWFPEDDIGARFRLANDGPEGLPAWAVGLGGMALIAAGMAALATRRLRTPAEVER